MRWADLFADLEAQVQAEHDADHRAEVADRSRRELASIRLLDRLTGHLGRPVRVGLRGVGPLDGRLTDAAEQWLLVEDASGRAALAPTAACLWVEGLGRSAVVPGEHSLARRLGLPAVLRTLAVQRIPLRIRLDDGAQVTGTIDRVHADHLDLADHAEDQQRRAHAVRSVRALPLAGLALVAPA
jgi:hypothetical protein